MRKLNPCGIECIILNQIIDKIPSANFCLLVLQRSHQLHQFHNRISDSQLQHGGKTRLVQDLTDSNR